MSIGNILWESVKAAGGILGHAAKETGLKGKLQTELLLISREVDSRKRAFGEELYDFVVRTRKFFYNACAYCEESAERGFNRSGECIFVDDHNFVPFLATQTLTCFTAMGAIRRNRSPKVPTFSPQTIA